MLVIDDDPEAREALRKHLQGDGYDVVVAADGREGLRLARELKPFAITLDVLMPELDGWEVLRGLKAAPETARIPVIIVSITDDRATGMALGAVGYVVKPVARQQLLAELGRIAAFRRIRRILVVDDDPAARALCSAMLSDRYPLVMQASGGREALEIAASEDSPDVMILDLIMPDLDGFAVLERLRSNPKTSALPVIIVTAKDLTSEERERLSSAVLRIIAKDGAQQARVLTDIDDTLRELERQQLAAGLGSKPLVLVVEDDAVAGQQICGALEGAGHAVTLASTAAEAMEQTQRLLPDGLVLDLMMPETDGFQLLEQLRSQPWAERLPVLVLTAKDLTAQDRERLERCQVRELAQKGSLDREGLVARVDRALGLRRDGRDEPLPSVSKVSARHSTKEVHTILVVEDNPDNRVAITAMLDEMGLAHRTAENGELGVEAAREHRPDLILMDVQLPLLSGLDATTRIKSEPGLGDIPIIALTAHAMTGDRERILAAGCDDYLSKPLDAGALEGMVQRWLKS